MVSGRVSARARSGWVRLAGLAGLMMHPGGASQGTLTPIFAAGR
jgi:hypothetical protein